MDLIKSINNLSRGRKLAIYLLLLLIVLTWLAVCLVIAISPTP
jgi:hypothetical protein